MDGVFFSSIIGLLLLGFLLVAVVGFVLWVIALVDCLKRSDEEFAAVGENRSMWLVVLLVTFFVLPLLGALVYWFLPRKKLASARPGR